MSLFNHLFGLIAITIEQLKLNMRNFMLNEIVNIPTSSVGNLSCILYQAWQKCLLDDYIWHNLHQISEFVLMQVMLILLSLTYTY
jgi:hypothetical protein